jgi:hypothetical protein
MKLPSFIILGAQKAGTTSLHNALMKHSDIYMSHPKEVSFFNIEKNYSRGAEWYTSFFAKRGLEKQAGETTPSYLWDERVPSRIAKVLPDAKFIVLLRNPVDRGYSAYWYAYRNGDETLPFKDALKVEAIRATQGDSIRGFSSYVDRGLYAQQIKRYLQFFDRSRFLFLISEEYQGNPRKTLHTVTRFLGVDCDEAFLNTACSVKKNVAAIPRSRRIHRCVPLLLQYFPLGGKIVRRLNMKKGPYPPLSSEVRINLAKRFQASNDELQEILQRNLQAWWA